MNILLVDDHVLFREGLASLLNAQPDLCVVGEAGSAPEAVELAHKLQPDLILMDVGLPEGSGVDATRAILGSRPETNVVFLTMHDEDDILYDGIRSGAKGYLLKNLPMHQLLAYVRGVERGEAAITPAMASRILVEFSRLRPSHGPVSRSELDELTEREIQVLSELAMGASNQEIAELFVITEGTVKNHVRNILAKLHLRNRREAASFARSHGLTRLLSTRKSSQVT